MADQGFSPTNLSREIVHLDINAFFASVEQQANPYLRDKPVAIIKAPGRTCVIAASYEAKKFGVKTGSRTWEAKSLCPEILFIPADFDKYWPLTQALVRIASLFSPDVEVFSLDEVFLDLTGWSDFHGGPIKMIKKIQARVAKEIGDQITLAAGLSYNRLLAKLASDLAGKNEILVITKENKDQFLAKIKPSTICGIGPRIEARLAKMGITNLLQIRNIPQTCLIASFGFWRAKRLKQMAWGIDDSLLTTLTELPLPKSASRTFTLFANTSSLRVVKTTLRNLCEEVAEKLRQMKMVGRTVGLGLQEGNRFFHREKTHPEPTDDGLVIFKRAWQIFEQSHFHLPARFIGIRASNLIKKSLLTAPLLPTKQKREKVLQAVDQVNQRFGSLTVFPATLLGQKLIRPEVTGFLSDKQLRFNFIKN